MDRRGGRASVPPPGTASTVPGTSSGSGSSSTGCEDESGEPPELCGPEEDEGNYNVRIDDDEFGEESIDVDVSCTVDAIDIEDEVRYTLACDDTQHVLDVRSNPPVDLELVVGDSVHLRAARNYPIDTGGYHFIALRDVAGELVAATYQPYRGEPPPEVDVVSFYSPLEFAAVDVGCEPVPDDSPGCGGTFIVDACATDDTRLAADFTVADVTIQIWSGTFADVGSLHVRADVQFHDPVGDGVDCPFGGTSYTTFWWTGLRTAK
jgi:hypothetical protein